MYWIADILLVLFLGLLLYRGIKKGFMNSPFTLISSILTLALGLGSAFAISYFVLPLFGWINDLQVGLIDFAGGFASLIKLLELELTTAEIALYLAYGISTLFLIAPMFLFWRWINKLFERFVAWVRSKSGFFKVLGSILGGLINFAVGAVIVLGMFWLFAALDGSGLFTFTNETLRAGYLTGHIYEYNPLYQFLGEPGFLAETVGDIIGGNF